MSSTVRVYNNGVLIFIDSVIKTAGQNCGEIIGSLVANYAGNYSQLETISCGAFSKREYRILSKYVTNRTMQI